MTDAYEHFDYTDENTGVTYRVEKCYDSDTTPLDMDSGIVTEQMNWDVTDEERRERFIDDYEPDMAYVARLVRMKPLKRHSYGEYVVFDTVATEDSLVKDGVASADVGAVAEKLYDWYRDWLDDRWHYMTLWVMPLDADGDPMQGEFAECLGGIESTEEDVNPYIKDLIHEVFWSQRSAAHANQLELNFN
tara:strand:- start:767 stop:1336 length:570 start_codon:yes stop_codon:yes gene_type:complete